MVRLDKYKVYKRYDVYYQGLSYSITLCVFEDYSFRIECKYYEHLMSYDSSDDKLILKNVVTGSEYTFGEESISIFLDDIEKMLKEGSILAEYPKEEEIEGEGSVVKEEEKA